MQIKCEIKEKTSKEGRKYNVLALQVTPTYTIEVYVRQSDIELLKLYNQNK